MPRLSYLPPIPRPPSVRIVHGAAGTTHLYDQIGIGYTIHRVPDPRLADAILHALGDAKTVLNVGAGAGSYEPVDRSVTAVEPSPAMIHQRSPGAAPVIQAFATHLPFGDASFDAALAILTVHHWPDRARGLAELARVARRRVVVFTCDPTEGFWLTEDYFPAIRATDRRILPAIDEFRRTFGQIEVRPVPVPHDCIDGFLGAYWRRPNAYLNSEIRGAMSAFSRIDSDAVERGLARLHADLEDGAWERKYGHLRHRAEIDLGYRLVVARPKPQPCASPRASDTLQETSEVTKL